MAGSTMLHSRFRYKLKPDVDLANRHPALGASSNGQAAFVRFESGPVLLPYYFPAGTAKYAINAPVVGSIALPVISPLLFMSLASARTPE